MTSHSQNNEKKKTSIKKGKEHRLWNSSFSFLLFFFSLYNYIYVHDHVITTCTFIVANEREGPGPWG